MMELPGLNHVFKQSKDAMREHTSEVDCSGGLMSAKSYVSRELNRVLSAKSYVMGADLAAVP